MIRPKKKLSSFLLSLALLAFLVRSVIPAGFMPEQRSAGNTYPLVICSGMGPVTINVPADKLPNPPAQPAHGHDNMPCPYAQAFAQGTLADHPELPQPLLASGSAPAHAETSLSLDTVVKSYFSHGPPELLA